MANRTTLVPDKTAKSSRKSTSANGNAHAERERIFALFRRWGFYESTLDPLGFFAPLKFPDLQDLSGEFAEEARRYYCGTVGAEFEHLPEPERRRWIAERLEGPEFEVNQEKILERLIRADLFEQVLQSRYLGRARAKLTRHGAKAGQLDRSKHMLNKVWTIVMHGDAAFAGQGIWAETLNLADLSAYTVGGSIHIVVNNLLGFTTRPAQEHSSRYASSIARRQSVPIFHVNAEDPDAVVRIGHLAAEYRAEFNSDVVIDLIGYRRHGHSEVDDPTITQPRLYERIKSHPPLWKSYSEHTGIAAA